MARSLNKKIDEAVDRMKRYGETVTPERVRVNVDVGWEDAQGVVEGSIMSAIRTRLKAGGHIITDATTGVREEFWESKLSGLREQLRIKKESSLYDANRILADEAVITFLEQKERDLGYEPYAGLFEDEIKRIYSMHSVDAPSRVAA